MEKCPVNIECCTEKRVLFIKDGYTVMNCMTCHRRFSEVSNIKTHLSDVYSDKYFFGGGDGYPNYLEEREILIKYGNYYAKKVDRFTKPGKVLDVGCAAGFILKGFENSGWEPYGVEPNETMASFGRSELNLNICTGSLEDYNSNVKFDLISLIQVIGHFHDIENVIEKISNLLNQNGLVLVESWNMHSLAARIMGKYWHEYSPPSVINWFSNRSLISLFQNHGYELVDTGFPAKRINLRHALSLIAENTPKLSFSKNLFDSLEKLVGKMIIFYPPVDLKWYLFRKQ